MNGIQDKALQANGINQSKMPDQQLKGIQDLVKRERRRLSVMKFLAGLFWAASLITLGLYMLAGKSYRHCLAGAQDPSTNELVIFIMVLETILPLAIIFATVCSVFLYIRAKSVNLLQVHERLYNLEEMVKVLLSK